MGSIVPPCRRRAGALGLAAILAAVTLAAAGTASAQDLQSQLSQKRDALRQARSNEAALSAALRHYSDRIDQLSSHVAALQAREASVQHQLVVTRAELARAKAKLVRVRHHLRQALALLEQRLVSIYMTNRPDIMTVILNAHGFSDLVSRTEYLGSIQRQDDALASRVGRLRDATRATVSNLETVRQSLAAQRAELTRTEATLRDRQASLATAQDRRRNAFAQAKANGRQLQGDIRSIQSQIQAQQAATEASGALGATTGPVLPSLAPGAIPPGQAVSPFPSSSPITWGRTDQGVDGETTPGSPLIAMGSGTVTIEHDPAGFGASYPVLSTSFGAFYYGHCVPVVADGTHVSVGDQIATAHTGTWGNSTTPGGFEIGTWPPGPFGAGASIRSWLIGLPRVR